MSNKQPFKHRLGIQETLTLAGIRRVTAKSWFGLNVDNFVPLLIFFAAGGVWGASFSRVLN